MVLPAKDSPPLAARYYRDNFQALCDTVEHRYADILSAQERAVLDDFRALDTDAQCLYVRLVSRVGPWFRESRLAYPELGEVGRIVDELSEAGMIFLASEYPQELSPEVLAGLFTLAELLQAFGPLLPNPPPRGKRALVAAIEALALQGAELLEVLAAVDDTRIIAPAGVVEVELFQLLFFGNRHQSLTDFVLSDLGIARYYPYSLDREYRLFPERAALEEYLACAALGERWHQLRESEEAADYTQLAADLLAMEVQYSCSESRWHRLCNGLARDLERQGELALATALYEGSRRHPARERRLRILERSEQWAAALALGEEILAEPWCEEERDAARRVLPRVQRRLGGKPLPRTRDDFPRLALALPQGGAPVELLAARRLQTQWRTVHYVENALMNTLFGLAFWEVIFAPVAGAFHNPFQSAPRDMYSSQFRQLRKRAIANRLAQLRAGDISSLLLEAYDTYAGFACRWADWRQVDRPLLAEVTRIVPAAHLLAIWERMLFDPAENRRGFPDLIALGEEPGEYSLIEVKGPGDALQESQKRWLRFFASEGIPAAVAWVSWEDAGDD